MTRLLTDMQNQPTAWAFARPVNRDEVLDYYEVIKNPMGKYQFTFKSPIRLLICQQI